MFKLIVDYDSLIKEYNKVTGSISIQADDIFFPEQDWNDFVIIILGWWIKGAYSLLSGDLNTCTNSFMDGPYEFDFHKKGALWKIILKQRRRDIKVIYEMQENPSLIIKDLLEVSNKVIQQSIISDWKDADFYELVRYNNLLKQVDINN